MTIVRDNNVAADTTITALNPMWLDPEADYGFFQFEYNIDGE